jgi:hypothetical protein
MKQLKVLIITLASIAMMLSTPAFAAGQFSFSPLGGTFYVGRQVEVNINITTDQATTASDVTINYDSCKLQMVDANTGLAGVQIFAGTVYPTYPNTGNSVTTAGCVGTALLTGFTSDSAGVLQGGGSGLFGKMRFLIKDENLAGSAITFYTQGFGPGFTLDSNISNTLGFDMLSAVTNANLILRTDNNPVPDADDRPSFTNLIPTINQAGVAIGSNLAFRVIDQESGVDISTVTSSISVNGGAPVVYNNSSFASGCSTTNYDAVPICDILINPSSDYPYDALVCNTITAGDLARTPLALANISNTNTTTYCFRTQYDLNAPYTTSNTPAKNSVGVSTGTPFSFVLTDNEGPVDINSLIVTIKGIDYTISGANTFAYTGGPNSYNIVVGTLPAFVENESVTVRIRAKDTATQLGIATPNLLDETYTFVTADTQAPVVSARSPAPETALLNACDPITFVVSDTGQGVDINSLRVYVSDGQLTYARTGALVFAYSGTPASYTVTVPAPSSCWSLTKPIAVGIFAKDTAGNYLDADIFAIGAPGSVQIITNTITNTITVPVLQTITEFVDRIKTLTVIEKQELIKTLEKEIGTVTQIKKEDEQKSLASGKITEVINGVLEVDKQRVVVYEGDRITVKGKSTPNQLFDLIIPEAQVKVRVQADDKGEWSAVLNGRVIGDKQYQMYAASTRDIGADSQVLGVLDVRKRFDIIDYWWLIVLCVLLGSLVGYLITTYLIDRDTKPKKKIR